MRKVLIVLTFLLIISVNAYANMYTDNINKFQVNLPANWQMSGAETIVDKDALFEIHQSNVNHSQRTLIGAKTTATKENREDFSFANSTESEKANIYAKTLKKASDNLPAHASIESHGFKDYGENIFLVTTINHQENGVEYKAFTAITYFNNIQYTFYLFINANNANALEDFDKMLVTFKFLS